MESTSFSEKRAPDVVVASGKAPAAASSSAQDSTHQERCETLDFSVIARARAAADAIYHACTIMEAWIPGGDRRGAGADASSTDFPAASMDDQHELTSNVRAAASVPAGAGVSELRTAVLAVTAVLRSLTAHRAASTPDSLCHPGGDSGLLLYAHAEVQTDFDGNKVEDSTDDVVAAGDPPTSTSPSSNLTGDKKLPAATQAMRCYTCGITKTVKWRKAYTPEGIFWNCNPCGLVGKKATPRRAVQGYLDPNGLNGADNGVGGSGDGVGFGVSAEHQERRSERIKRQRTQEDIANEERKKKEEVDRKAAPPVVHKAPTTTQSARPPHVHVNRSRAPPTTAPQPSSQYYNPYLTAMSGYGDTMGAPQPRNEYGFPSPFPPSPSLYTPHELMYMRQPSAQPAGTNPLYMSRYGAGGPGSSSTPASGGGDLSGQHSDSNRVPPETSPASSADTTSMDSNALLSFAPKGRLSGMLSPQSPYGFPLSFSMPPPSHGQPMRAPAGPPFSAFGSMLSPYQPSPLDGRYPPHHGWSSAYANMFVHATPQSQDGTPSSHPAASVPRTPSQ